jgi:phosphatidylglycerophosphatase A
MSTRSLNRMNRFLVISATLGGIGKCPFASGSLATLVPGIPAAIILAHTPAPLALLVVVLITVLGIFGAQQTIRELGREDPREVVVDELAGYLVTMLWLPISWVSVGAGFCLFRLFDIWKPWPVRWADTQVKGGLGAMLDDVLAGLMAHVLLRLLLALIH